MIIADTGFWLALASRTDANHPRAKRALATYRGPYVRTWPVMTETCHLLSARLGTDVELAFLRSAVRGAFEVFGLAEEQGSGDILSTDRRYFGAYRWKNRKPFKNLLFP